MNLQISTIRGKGSLNDERIVLKVLDDGDMGHFALLQTGVRDSTVNIKVFHAYWFPWHKVFAGDLVVLYTKAGSSRQKSIDEGETAHFFYWDLSQAIWGEEDRGVVLLHAPIWSSNTPDQLSAADEL